MDRDTGKAVEESLLAQVEDLHTYVIVFYVATTSPDTPHLTEK